MIHYKTHSSVAIVKADKHLERVTAHSILMCTFLGSHEHPTARPMNSFVDILSDFYTTVQKYQAS